MAFGSAISREVCPPVARSRPFTCAAMERANVSQQEECATLIGVLASLIERVVARNKHCSPQSEGHCQKFAAFSGRCVPSISILQYLERIFAYAKCSDSCYVVAYLYIDRLLQQHPDLRITSLNIHRILIASILISAKFLDDRHYDNGHYARIGGISTKDLNQLEWSFLFLIDFRLHVNVNVYQSYCSHLEREVAFGGGYRIEKALEAVCADHRDSERCQTHSIPRIQGSGVQG
ncbi:hypothetical protein KP509_07G089200 [Ceratopteris richardii]|uniref:Cyclin n=1 Tax=Ceratopteris richardii TaxID=49495 RepID=A0A8T2UNK4_CERRI|nr:hypothetical protein KP509_07G089200 [Ceratopteris richardii]